MKWIEKEVFPISRHMKFVNAYFCLFSCADDGRGKLQMMRKWTCAWNECVCFGGTSWVYKRGTIALLLLQFHDVNSYDLEDHFYLHTYILKLVV